MVNSIQKGKSFERLVAKLLTYLSGEEWKRVPQSGAMATTENISDNKFKGDVFSECKEMSNIIVECKVTNKKISLGEIFNNNSILWRWWDQAKKQAGIPDRIDEESQIVESKSIPLLIFKVSGSNDVYMVYYEEHDFHIYFRIFKNKKVRIMFEDLITISKQVSKNGMEIVDIIRIPSKIVTEALKTKNRIGGE